MNPSTIGILGIALLLILFLLRMPVAFAMIFVGVLGFAALGGIEPAFSILAQDLFETFSSYPLSVIPMFIMMGSFAFASGISQRLYKTAYAWVGPMRGGLTIATVLACAGFAAICGSTAATAATMGRIALPEMRKYGYDTTLSTGTVAASGALGILIPPSTILIVYGILTEESIGKLFIAGVLPGILLSFFFVATVAILCIRDPKLGPPGKSISLKEKLIATTGIIEAAILFVLTIGGLFLGWFSPTQAGAIGAGGALLIGLGRRQLNWKRFISASKDGLQTSCMVLFIIASATVFGHFMAISNIPFMLADWIGQLPVSPIIIMGVIIFIYFLGGFFMDSMALVVVTIPIFFPVVMKLGFDPIWFGVIIVLVAEMGVITPPVGVNVFVIKGIAPDIPLHIIFKGIFPFLWALIILTALLMIFPQIATFLPSLVSI
ncbi:MAG: TRAP transporter large permease [Deltaproteobacteria bacterium]|nr:TRAP transporter large permease [Deltaproteobacteria bacterium]MBW2017541.1 TRAP transporter large permease [Deltaproteobacteria bacterium]MBW2128060.1 TRAP transporter large permease [Deltaproteobacteria bacterium]MBW2304080.1 TRAP transporter large permease [Deltaproteobacteria bacterium]